MPLSTPVLGEAGNNVQKGFLEMWVEFLTSHARSPQLLGSSHPIVVGLEQALGRYTDDVATLSHHAEKRCVWGSVGVVSVGGSVGVHVPVGVCSMFPWSRDCLAK